VAQWSWHQAGNRRVGVRTLAKFNPSVPLITKFKKIKKRYSNHNLKVPDHYYYTWKSGRWNIQVKGFKQVQKSSLDPDTATSWAGGKNFLLSLTIHIFAVKSTFSFCDQFLSISCQSITQFYNSKLFFGISKIKNKALN